MKYLYDLSRLDYSQCGVNVRQHLLMCFQSIIICSKYKDGNCAAGKILLTFNVRVRGKQHIKTA